MKNVIITASSIEYFHYLDILIKSYYLNEINKDNIQFNVTIILKNKEEDKIYNDFIYNFKDEIIDKINFNIHYVINSEIEFKAYCAHHKFFLFKKYINDYEKILWLDTDSIIKGTLIDLFNLQNFDCCLKKRNDEYLGNIYAGVILINNKKLINTLIKKYNKMKYSWYNDQLVFNKILKDNKFNIIDLENKYFGLDCNETDLIWLCKGRNYSLEREIWQNEINLINNKIK